MSHHFNICPGDRASLDCEVISISRRTNKARVAIGRGTGRSIITVPLNALSPAMSEAVSWAANLLGENL